MPDSSTGPGPVLTKDAIEKGIVSVLSSVALLTARYGWWSPSGEDVLTIAGVIGSVYAFLGLVASFFTREQVRPEADVQKAIEQGVAERLAARDAQRAQVTVRWPPVGVTQVSPPATAQQAYTD
jgi:hypothetical protein